jgi:hypothetical protein
MLSKTVTIILTIIGFGTVTAGFITGSQDTGSCPDNNRPCFHTFPGINILIGEMSTIIKVVGLVILAAALVVAMYTKRVQTTATKNRN